MGGSFHAAAHKADPVPKPHLDGDGLLTVIKSTHVSIDTGGGNLTIGGSATVGSIADMRDFSENQRSEQHLRPIEVPEFDVFISYAHADQPLVLALAHFLEQQGLNVWFDRELVAGDQFVRQINARLDAARWILVIWSESSVVSDWVLNEAEIGRRRGVLLSVTYGIVDIPAPFTLAHSPSLSQGSHVIDYSVLNPMIQRLLSTKLGQ